MNKILNDVDQGRISIALEEIRKCKERPAKSAFKDLQKWTDVIEELVENAHDLHEEHAEMISEALGKYKEEELEEGQKEELEMLINMFDVLQ